MPNLGGMPDLGNDDFTSLARLSQPNTNLMGMIGQVPTLGGMAGQIYGQQEGRQNDYMSKAADLAQLKAQMQRGAIDEYNMAAPGRVAGIESQNIEAQDALEMAKSGLPSQIKRQKATTELSEAHRKEIESKSDIWSALANAPTPQEAQRAVAQFGPRASFGGRPLAEMDPTKLQQFGKQMQRAITQSTATLQKEDVEGTKGSYKVEAAEVAAAGGITKANIMAASREDITKAARENKAKSTDQLYEMLMEKYSKGIPLSPHEAEALKTLQLERSYKAAVAAATVPPVVGTGPTGKTTLVPAPVPARPQPPNPNPAGSGQGIKLDLDKNMAIVNGQEIAIVAKNKAGTKAKLANGMEVPIQ